jgi:quinol monooxygenase YgiN
MASWGTIPAHMPKRKAKKAVKRRSSRKSRGAKITKLPKGALTLVVMLRAKEGQHLLLEAELRALVGPTRKEEGCLQYDLHRAAEQPGAFLFHEVWESREHHAAHTRTSHFLRWNARKDSLLASKESTFWQQIA